MKSYTNVNLAIPVDNQSFTFEIPVNKSSLTKNFGISLPDNHHYYRYIDSITYRVDTSGLYNINSVQELYYIRNSDPTPIYMTIMPGFYNLNSLNALFVGFLAPIDDNGAFAFRAKVLSTITVVNFHNAPLVAQILNFGPDQFVDGKIPGSTISDYPVNLTLGYDMMLVFCSITRQSTENNLTNIAAIPIQGTIGNVIQGTQLINVPILAELDSINSITVSIKKIDGSEYILDTPVFLNLSVKFASKIID